MYLTHVSLNKEINKKDAIFRMPSNISSSIAISPVYRKSITEATHSKSSVISDRFTSDVSCFKGPRNNESK